MIIMMINFMRCWFCTVSNEMAILGWQLEQVLVAFSTFCLCWWLFTRRRQLPDPNPGTRHPPCLATFPVIGSLLFLPFSTKNLVPFFIKKSKSLGSVYAVYFGPRYKVGIINYRFFAITMRMYTSLSRFLTRHRFRYNWSFVVHGE